MVAGFHYGEHELVWLPFVVRVVALAAGVFGVAYAIYLDEHNRTTGLENEVNGLKEQMAAAEKRHAAEVATAEQKALSHGEFNKFKQELVELARDAVEQRPRSGTNATLPVLDRQHAEKVKGRLLDWLARARWEARKVTLQGYLAMPEDLQSLPIDIDQIQRRIHHQTGQVDTIIQKLASQDDFRALIREPHRGRFCTLTWEHLYCLTGFHRDRLARLRYYLENKTLNLRQSFQLGRQWAA